MHELLSLLLGHRGAGTVVWLGRWTAGAAILLAVVALWTFICYSREGRPMLPGRLALTLLRVAAVATLLVLLFEPALRTERVDRHRSTVAILVDRSESMAIQDRWTDPAQRRALGRWARVADPSAFPRSEWARLALGASGRDEERGTRDEERGKPPSGPRSSSLVPRSSTNAWLRSISRVHDVHLYAFADGRRATTVAGLRGPVRLPGDSTRLGDAIEATLEEFAGQPLAGIVVLSDGGSNRGEDPMTAASQATERHVPIFTVGIGDPTPPRDLAVASLLVDDVIRKGDEVPVVVGLKHTGIVLPAARARPLTTRVTLREDRQVLATRTVVLSSGQQEVQFPYRPARAGAHTLQVSAAPFPGEISLRNNTRAATVHVVEKQLRVLYVESSPRWEYRYLKNAILRDPSVKLACLLLDSEPSGGGEGNLKITGFPTDRKAFFDYDVVILGDVARSSFSDAQLDLLRAFVEERGGSLLVMAGEAHMPWEYRGTPLEELLPAVIPSGPHGVSTEAPFQFQLTAAGARHPMMQLEADPVANIRRWETLPGGYWHGDVGRVKPGATVLLETGQGSGVSGQGSAVRAGSGSGPSPRTADPLVLLQPVGEGMTLLSLTDSTWRWRYRLGDTEFYRYWGQVIRTLTPHELPGNNRLVKVTVDRESYQPGERVVVRARALTPAFHPLRAPSLAAGILSDDGTRVTVPLAAEPGSPGVFSADWLPPRPGEYRVVTRAPASSAVAEVAFTVQNEPLERQEPEMNRDLLQQVAQISGGRYLDVQDLNRLPRLIPDRTEVQVIRTERPLWDTPLPLAVFSLLLVGEWMFRKRAGLL